MSTYFLTLVLVVSGILNSVLSIYIIKKESDGLPHLSTSRQWDFGIGNSSKFFPLFPIVRINNSPCIPELVDTIGTCFTRTQCRNVAGIVSGSCASGFGVCCVVAATCDATITQNNTAYQNRDFPSSTIPTGLEICTVRVQKPSSNVCQLHLEFTTMELASADHHGLCVTDRFAINGVTATPANICGNLTGQHMYLDFGSNDRVTISVITDGAVNQYERMWNIKTKYIECNSLARAPQGCLQYYTSSSDEVRILGYPMVPHLANLDYTVCVRNEDDSGSIAWASCQGVTRETAFTNFAMSGNGTNNATSGVCNEDYVLIMTDDASTPMTKMDDRYCGTSLIHPMLTPQVVRSFAHPFIMRVKTDSSESELDLDNIGFCLAYRQEPPTTSRGK